MPRAFQNYINNILYNIFNIYTTAYFNDVFIYSNNKQDYKYYINDIFERLIKAGLSININKYKFYAKYIKYLGLIIILGGIEINLEKIKAVTE